LIPQMLRWGNTAAAEPLATAASAWAVASAAWFTSARTAAALGWMVALTAFAVQVRPESLLIIPVVAAVVAMFAPEELQRPRLWWATLGGVILCALAAGHLVAMRHESWQATGARFSFEYARRNLPTNLGFYVADERFPVIYTALAAVAAAMAANRRALAVLAIWFLAFWSVFVFFYAGSYNWGANVRYSLMTYAPLAVLAGAGAGWLGDGWLRVLGRAAVWVVVAALVFQFLWYMPQARDVGEESWAARADVVHAREFAALAPPESMILTQNPNMFLLWGQNAAQLSLATTDEDYVRRYMLSRFTGGVYVHWNFWCNVPDELQQSFCRNALDRFPTELVAERTVRDQRFALYRILTRGPSQQ
jgi:hypothetical protein